MQTNYHTCAVRPQIKLSEWDILSSLPNALIILNSQGRIVWLNPSAESMLGYGLINCLWAEVTERAFLPKEDEEQEVSLIDGRRVHLSKSVLDSLPGTLITLSDITASREYLKAREKEKRLASIGTMTAQLAHQIRTPLASAMLFTEHLHNLKDLDVKTQQRINRIQNCHSSIEQQIKDLLLFAKGTPIVKEWVNMGSWCTELTYRAQPYLETHSAQLKINNKLKIREAYIHNESLIGAILNLIINALQAEAKKIHLTLATKDHLGIQIAIHDNGQGMSEETRAQAFAPFYTTKAQGTGLGLAVVFAVINAHGGKVFLDSELGVGTQIDIRLPGKTQD